MNKPLIGLTGFKGSGKSTVARILVEQYGYEEISWAGELKFEVWQAFGKAVLLQNGYEDSFSDWLTFLDQHKYDGPYDEFGWVRPLLQFWGTEYRRNLCEPDYWVNKLLPELGSDVVVSDCRFHNEVYAITNHPGVVWRIWRPDREGDDHPSERYIPSLHADVEIENNGDIAHLAHIVQQLMQEQQ